MKTRTRLTLAAVVMASGVSVLLVSGSSHRDAPLIAEDPLANNTDVYAFRSTEPGREDFVTIIANYIPNQEPGDGPTYHNFSDNVLYEIHVDVNGNGKEDLTYQFDFSTVFGAITPNTFLYNVGTIGPPEPVSGKPPLPTAQYTNLNVHQSYTLSEVRGDRRTGQKKVLLPHVRVAPANIGPFSTPSYEALADLAIHSFQLGGGVPGGRVFAGPRDEGFYVDLMAAFDLLGGFTAPQRPPVDSFSGFNVHSIALEIPIQRFQAAGDTDGVIGVWASASRPRVTVRRGDGKAPVAAAAMVQVSRLGMPLVNELLLPFSQKDLFNASEPKDDVANGIVDFVVDPGPTQGGASLVPLLASILPTGCAPDSGRIDLDLIFFRGIPGGLIPGFAGNQNTESGTPVRAEMLRLNYDVPRSTTQNPLGVLAGDFAGFPNGRRVGDDVVDIALRALAGAVLHSLSKIDCPASLTLTDGVDGNDRPYLERFPYLGTPHQGYDHKHKHGLYAKVALAVGSGLLASAILTGAVFAVRRRRGSMIGY